MSESNPSSQQQSPTSCEQHDGLFEKSLGWSVLHRRRGCINPTMTHLTWHNSHQQVSDKYSRGRLSALIFQAAAACQRVSFSPESCFAFVQRCILAVVCSVSTSAMRGYQRVEYCSRRSSQMRHLYFFRWPLCRLRLLSAWHSTVMTQIHAGCEVDHPCFCTAHRCGHLPVQTSIMHRQTRMLDNNIRADATANRRVLTSANSAC